MIVRAASVDAVETLTDEQYRSRARYLWDAEDELRVDPDAKVSRTATDGGAWVQAWVWVPEEASL